MKKVYTRLMVLMLAAMMLLTACGGQPTPAQPQQSSSAGGEKGKFALVLSGPRDDHSWNQAAYEALEAMKKDGVETTISERVAPADAPRVLRELATAGYQMIVAHSFGYQDAAFAVAKEFPEANFAWGGGINKTTKNVADYDQPFYQAAYLVGIIGGHVSKTGKFGALYGFDIPVCHSMGEALVAGAKTVNPKAELTFTAVGDWYDAAKAKEAGLAQADTGVDFWISCGEGPTLGSIEAAKERKGFATGYVGDMSSSGPDVVLTNIVWNLEPMFRDMLKSTLDKSFNAPYYRYGIKENALDISINPKLADKIPAEAMKAVEEAKAKIKSGELEVPFVAGAE